MTEPFAQCGDNRLDWPQDPVPTTDEAYIQISCNFRGANPDIQRALGLINHPQPKFWQQPPLWAALISAAILLCLGIAWLIFAVWQP